MDAGIIKRNPTVTLEERLEQGEVHVLETSLALPSADDQAFLREQELHRAKEIVLEPGIDRFTGYRFQSAEQSQRLRRILDESREEATRWLIASLPRYAAGAVPLRTCFHVAEEATRRLRMTARYDLLHIDALHHSLGHRLLRLFVNLNPTDPRVWASSETLAKALPEFGSKMGLISETNNPWPRRLGQKALRLFRADAEEISPYDEFMLALSRSLKHSDEFQEKAPRKIWRFAPGQAWLAFTDTLIHADLRGRWVLDHLFLVPTKCCVHPNLSPAALLADLRTLRSAA